MASHKNDMFIWASVIVKNTGIVWICGKSFKILDSFEFLSSQLNTRFFQILSNHLYNQLILMNLFVLVLNLFQY